MKTHFPLLVAVTLSFTAAAIHAQSSLPLPTAQAQAGPRFTGYLSQLFADNPAFTANLEFHSYGVTTGNAVMVQGRISYLNGKTRFEMNMADAGDANLPRQDASSLSQMGMDTMITISSPKSNVDYFVYPDRKSYVRHPFPAAEAAATAAGYSLEVTAVGDENVLGRNCVKNKVIATGADGVAHQSIVWNATDLNNFPIKIQTTQNGASVVMLFKDLKLDAPDAALFNPPADYKQYNDFVSLMTSHAGTQAPQ